MSARPYDCFLAERFMRWAAPTVRPGHRYQFKSPDVENAKGLYAALIELATGPAIRVDGISLPAIACGDAWLIPVLHGSEAPGFTENYISRLRDEIAGGNGAFASAALLVIHNSMLDTLINSAQDLAAPDAIWDPRRFKDELIALIDQRNPKRGLSRCLLEDQLASILEQGATVFGYAPLFPLLTDGKLEFAELGLFDDPLLESFTEPAQIRKRLEVNRKLRHDIEFKVENFGEQLEDKLKDFSPKFVREHFLGEKPDWSRLQLQDFLDEEQKNAAPGVVFTELEAIGATAHHRPKSHTKSGQKSRSVLVQVPAGGSEVCLQLGFQANDLDDRNFAIKHNPAMKATGSWSIRRAGKLRWAEFVLPFDGTPAFFTIDLRRENRSECYQFQCLMIGEGQFYLEPMLNHFRIDAKAKRVTLMLEDNRLRVHPTANEVIVLGEEDGPIDVAEVGFVDFEALANQLDEVGFTLRSSGRSLAVNVESPAADEGVKLPLLFDQERLPRLFRDEYNGEYNRTKKKIVIDNCEISAVGVRMALLDLEARFVDERLIAIAPGGEVPLSDLATTHPELHGAYAALFDALGARRTLPSLLGWGPGFRARIQAVLSAYEQALEAIPLHAVLDPAQKRLMAVGTVNQDGHRRFSPFHPLVLAYHLELVEQIVADRGEDGASSFATLPDVTLERLVASGLLPFVYDPGSDYAQVEPASDNAFWLEVTPQRDASYDFVRRLVRDKLREFTRAYARLFEAGPLSGLIINAINQGYATELFLGLADYYNQEGESALRIHVNFYDDALAFNAFDRFSEIASAEQLKAWFVETRSATRADADALLDLVRSRLTYSKFQTPGGDEPLAYAHLAFFRNNARVECRPVDIEQAASGVLCDGLIAGEAAETKGGSYFTAFGLRDVDYKGNQALRLARLIGGLMRPALESNSPYLGTGVSLAVSTEFKQLLTRSYASSLWTTIIDPKVTLDFFTSHQDVLLIHYSDQYTSSAGYDAITVTQHVDIFRHLVGTRHMLAEFNAFNGEWLLKMLTDDEKRRKERTGIIGAYKFVRAILAGSDVAWVPLSVAEIIRVSGNVGLPMKASEFSRHNHGHKQGAISDDVLFVGFRGDELFLLPLEVKTGARPDFTYAGKQARELRRYLAEEVLGPLTLASKLYRGLFIRQVLIQLEKFRLYRVIDETALSPLLGRREWWLRGEYGIGDLPDYPRGFVLAHVQNETCFAPTFLPEQEGILPIELPYSLLDELTGAKDLAEVARIVDACRVPVRYLLAPGRSVVPGVVSPAIVAQRPAPVDMPSGNSLRAAEPPPPPYISETPTPPSVLRVLLGHETFRSAPLYWEPTNTAKFMNTNSGIIGTMGTGKTQFTKSLVTQLVRNHGDNVDGAQIGVLIFDYKSDYIDDAFVTATGARKLKLHRLPYNPLSLFGDTPMLPVHTAAGFVETMARAYQLGPKQQTKLRSMILACYEAAGILPGDPSTWGNTPPTLDHVWRRFNAQERVEEDSLHAALLNLIEFEIFESDPTKMVSLYDLVDRVTVIELAKYPSEVQSLIVALTLDLFYAQMQKQGKPRVQGDLRQVTKMILVDEADNFMSQDFPALRKILKEGREYGVGVILSTQELTHFKTGENDYSSYVMTWVVHRVSQIKNADIKAIFNKDDKTEQGRLMEEIRSLEKHQSLLIDGAKRVVKMRDKPFWMLEAELLQGAPGS